MKQNDNNYVLNIPQMVVFSLQCSGVNNLRDTNRSFVWFTHQVRQAQSDSIRQFILKNKKGI